MKKPLIFLWFLLATVLIQTATGYIDYDTYTRADNANNVRRSEQLNTVYSNISTSAGILNNNYYIQAAAGATMGNGLNFTVGAVRTITWNIKAATNKNVRLDGGNRNNDAVCTVYFNAGTLRIGRTSNPTSIGTYGNKVYTVRMVLNSTNDKCYFKIDNTVYTNGTAGYAFDAVLGNISRERVLYNAFGLGASANISSLYICNSYNLSCGVSENVNGIIVNSISSITGSPVYPFTVTFTNGTRRTNNTGGTLYFNFTNGNYTFTANASGYIPVTRSVNLINTSFQQVTFLPDNNIRVNFRNEKDRSVVMNNSFVLICDGVGTLTYSLNRSTKNGTSSISGIPPGICQIRYKGFGNTLNSFRPRSYYFKVPLTNNTIANTTLYQIETNLSSLFQRIIIDTNAQPLTGYYIDVQKFFTRSSPTTGDWETVEIEIADVTGATVFAAVPNTEAYRFRILNQSLDLYSILTPQFLTDISETLTINKTSGILTTFTACSGITARLSNTSTMVLLDYADPSLSASSVCLSVDRTYIVTTYSNTSCSSSHSATLMRPYNTSLPGQTAVNAYANVSGTICYLTNYVFPKDPFNAKTAFKQVGPFLYIGAILLAATLSFVNPIMGIVGIFLVVVGFSQIGLGLFQYAMISVGGILVTCIIVIYLFTKGRG